MRWWPAGLWGGLYDENPQPLHNDWSMDMIADAAHICVVVAFKVRKGQV